MTKPAIDSNALDLLFRDARSQNSWLDKPIEEGTLEAIYDLMKWGPTSANGFPMRIVFVTTDVAKEKLASTAMSGNQDKIRSAPATAILGNDAQFFEQMDKLFPHNPGMAELFRGNSDLADITAFRNGTLQGAYFMIAARAFGLDCGPMSGFDNAACDELFFKDSNVKSNFICSIGYGDPEGLFDRLPRPAFGEVCTVI